MEVTPQMKIIIAILPQNVKQILEEVSPTYRKYVPNSPNERTKTFRNKNIQPEVEPTSEVLLNSNKTRNKKQIVVPSSIEKNLVKKVTLKSPLSMKNIKPEFDEDDDIDDEDDDNEELEDMNTTPKRGRPAK